MRELSDQIPPPPAKGPKRIRPKRPKPDGEPLIVFLLALILELILTGELWKALALGLVLCWVKLNEPAA